MAKKEPEVERLPAFATAEEPLRYDWACFAAPKNDIVIQSLSEGVRAYASTRRGLAFVVIRAGTRTPPAPLVFNGAARVTVTWHRSLDGAKAHVRACWSMDTDEPLAAVRGDE